MTASKKFISVVIIIIVFIGGYYFLSNQGGKLIPPLPTVTPPSGQDKQGGENLLTYRNDVYKFSLQYPSVVMFLTDKNKIAELSYIPICEPETTTACFVYPKETYPTSNFEAAGVAVGVLPDKKTANTCLAAGNGEQKANSKTINGVAFTGFSFGDAAAGHQSGGHNYRAFHNNICFQLSDRITTTTYENYEPGSIVRFSDTQRNQLQKNLDAIIQTFRFEKVL